MRHLGTTVVAIVGTDAETWAGLAGAYPNVRLVTAPDPAGPGPEADPAPLDRAITVWADVVRSRVRYTVHTADPLAAVGAAWVARYDGVGVAGDLEVAVSAAVGVLDGRRLDLPDYYLVVDADQLPVTWRHWYFGVLGGARVHRVVPVRADAREIRRALGRFGAGPWWPEPAELLGGIHTVVPDRVGVPARSVVQTQE